jgi:hypothetical protein
MNVCYASNTRVSSSRSRDEIERTLIRYGAERFFYGNSGTSAGIAFSYKGRVIKFNIPFPSRDKFKSNKSGEIQYDREIRRLWRVLLLGIKAKLELVNSNLTSFEDEFLAQTCLPDGSTVSQYIQPQIAEGIKTGSMPKLLMEGVSV